MKKWSKDIIRSAVVGFVLPAVLLAGVVAATEQPEPTETVRPGVPITLPVLITTAPWEQEPLFLPVVFGGETVQMELEEYLVGVLLAEVPTAFDPEALKAQAVAARTYALKTHRMGYKHNGGVCTTAACCQGYLSPETYIEDSGDREGVMRARQAVEETSSQVLTYDGKLILATYFDCSGGSTEDAAAVWGKIYPYLQAVQSPGEENAPHYSDAVTFTARELLDTLELELPGQPEDWFGTVCYTPGGGVDTMEIGGRSFRGTDLRIKLGLRSTVFTVAVSEGTITFSTLGYGHRVGLSQYGAEAMAVCGSTYDQILQHYYPGTKLENYKFEP